MAISHLRPVVIWDFYNAMQLHLYVIRYNVIPLKSTGHRLGPCQQSKTNKEIKALYLTYTFEFCRNRI